MEVSSTGKPSDGPTLDRAALHQSAHVKKQHLVSKVLLKRFTTPDTKSGEKKLASFDLNYPSSRPQSKNPTEVGYSLNFITVDSKSLEDLWGETERMAPAVFAAIDRGDPYATPGNSDVLRDLIALHLVRSHHYKAVHHSSYHRARERLREKMLGQHLELTRSEAFRRTGLYLHGSALEAVLDRILEDSAPAQGFDKGELLRTNIEDMFHKARDFISDWEPELITAKEGNYIIGDSPAITLRWPSGNPDLSQPVQRNVAIGDAHAVILPIGPKNLVALGPKKAAAEVERPVVEILNLYQISVARRHIFFQPDGVTERFIREASSNMRPTTSP